MFNQSRLQPRRIQPAFAGVVPSQPVVNVDADRAPVTFGWWLYADGRFLGNCHLETLYRLDRVDARLGDHSAVSPLEPSEHYGHTTEELRELLRGRQQALLPRVPAGHRWIGPQLVQELPCMVVHTRIGAGKLHGRERNLPRDRRKRGWSSRTNWPAGSLASGSPLDRRNLYLTGRRDDLFSTAPRAQSR